MASSLSTPPSERPGIEQPHSELPRTVSGKRPSAAALQREHEYVEWLSSRDVPDGDAQLDDSWRAFMAERRARQQKARLAKVNEQREESSDHQRGLKWQVQTPECRRMACLLRA